MYSIEEVQNLYRKGEPLEFIFFSGHQKTKNGNITKSCLSQWYSSPFEMNNVKYSCAEQYMMAEKARIFQDDDALDKILNAYHPNQMKMIGRKVKKFDEEVWNREKINVVKIANIAKFSQNPKLKKYLLGTGSKILVKTNGHESIWGIGLAKDDDDIYNPLKWKGKNLLGFILMDIREIFS
ncbi:NADAR family protein [uncultured Clostridium sp.]|uniref:NADAR family protein n=1 Tax=uncultured Clostridium sp. TaxID=59620 RepID=UPI0025EA87DA|nr:NADAR family protein [uncultured Clostridium sp.]